MATPPSPSFQPQACRETIKATEGRLTEIYARAEELWRDRELSQMRQRFKNGIDAVIPELQQALETILSEQESDEDILTTLLFALNSILGFTVGVIRVHSNNEYFESFQQWWYWEDLRKETKTESNLHFLVVHLSECFCDETESQSAITSSCDVIEYLLSTVKQHLKILERQNTRAKRFAGKD
ncbi:hypothetical protein EJ05DRAFT_515681 [Pseudovirgaria hyperparasitica]|uniref:Uncharacterized protein n=1 Tax=Pseudovirgaria hyperparasitica TaxID=470096 RepID=A0A6A6VT16_9PEZI|nr:uncharacterized protein EJ05DRAFT_515681 [Pseudovirgaria hyperparasitica]KAF2752387.1 hypothetical protein EJ05DRAFT_515681 [Pseudovirgaria hyperparasitica]